MAGISSITTGPRQSNIELLRIFAMFLVLIVHVDFWTFGAPLPEEFVSSPGNAWIRTIVESVAIVCVNVFVLISGWFGIRFSIRGLLNFIFQCAYFLIGIYAVMMITGYAELSFRGIAACFCLAGANWFILAYVGLYILSPVLNSFIEHATPTLYRRILILFFLFQTIYGFSNAADFFERGYSTLSFVGLYLLARYVKNYHVGLVTRWGGMAYVFSVICNSVMYYAVTRLQIPIDVYAYVNPLVIIGSLGLLGFFWKLRVPSNRTINWVAKSAFAVLLLHLDPNIGVPIFKVRVMEIYDKFSGVSFLGMILVFLILVFSFAIILDQPRKWIWNLIVKKWKDSSSGNHQ